MPQVSKSVLIPRPPQEVFDYLADFDAADWDPEVAEAAKTSSGDTGLGSTFDLVTLFRGRRIDVTCEVTAFEPSTRVVLVGKNNRFTGTDDIGVTPEGVGAGCRGTPTSKWKASPSCSNPSWAASSKTSAKEAMDGLKETLSSIPPKGRGEDTPLPANRSVAVG